MRTPELNSDTPEQPSSPITKEQNEIVENFSSEPISYTQWPGEDIDLSFSENGVVERLFNQMTEEDQQTLMEGLLLAMRKNRHIRLKLKVFAQTNSSGWQEMLSGPELHQPETLVYKKWATIEEAERALFLARDIKPEGSDWYQLTPLLVAYAGKNAIIPEYIKTSKKAISPEDRMAYYNDRKKLPQ